MSEDRRKKYLRIFKAEADEHLSAINLGLLDLEKGTAGAETIHNIFRAAHTLKGSARMLGLEEIGAIAHKMEDILKEVETGDIKPSSEVVDRLLEGADSISKILLSEGGPTDVDSEAVVARLVEVMETKGQLSGGSAPPAEPEAPPPEPEVTPPSSPEPPPAQPAPPEPRVTEPPPSATTRPKPLIEEPAKPEEPSHARVQSDTLRVEASRLDKLIDLSGELLINKLRLEGRVFSVKAILDDLTSILGHYEKISGDGMNLVDLKNRLQDVRSQMHGMMQELNEDVIELDMNVQDVQGSALQLRMTPASTLFDEFPRLVRDLARDLKKEIALEVRGQDTEIDKRLLEQLKGPLIHIIRNACDHGIEPPDVRVKADKPRQGKIQIHAYHHGSSVVIDLIDDGAGMDPKRIRETAVSRGLIDQNAADELTEEETYYLTLRPGFTTSAIITDLSGRGVGLDVVKTNVEALRGDLSIASRPGQGLTIQLRLPLTISIISALLVAQSGEAFAIPLSAVEEVARIKVKELVSDRGREAITVRGKLLPLVRLGTLLGMHSINGTQRQLKSSDDMLHVVILKFRNQHLAMEVDQTLREQEILVKTLGSHLKRSPLISGATILRKGEPALILNVFDIFNEALRMEERVGIKQAVMDSEADKRIPKILVVDDSITTRTIEKNILDRAGYDVTTAVHAEEALEIVNREDTDFDLFVVDVDMPGMNGFELTEQLRQLQKTMEIPVIICTSRSSDEDKRRGISVGAQGYIVKGAFDQNVLLDTVKSLIGE